MGGGIERNSDNVSCRSHSLRVQFLEASHGVKYVVGKRNTNEDSLQGVEPLQHIRTYIHTYSLVVYACSQCSAGLPLDSNSIF